MDTRRKILTPAAALQLSPPPAVVTGYFDVLRAEHARELEQVRNRTGRLLVMVLPLEAGLLDQRARAELVAALRMVDYVVTVDDGDLDGLLNALKPAEIVRLESADARRTRELIEHVQRRQTR